MSNQKHLLVLDKVVKNLEGIDRRLAAARREAEMQEKHKEMDTLAEELICAKLEEQNARTKQVAIQVKELAQTEIQLKRTQSQKVINQLQPNNRTQKSYRTFKASSISAKPSTGHELRERSAHSQNDMNEVTAKDSHLRNNKELCSGRIDSKSIVG